MGKSLAQSLKTPSHQLALPPPPQVAPAIQNVNQNVEMQVIPAPTKPTTSNVNEVPLQDQPIENMAVIPYVPRFDENITDFDLWKLVQEAEEAEKARPSTDLSTQVMSNTSNQKSTMFENCTIGQVHFHIHKN